MCYHQVIHIGEEQKKSINKQKFIILDIKHSIINAKTRVIYVGLFKTHE